MSEKIQKILAAAGLGSRREIEEWLREGRISVNGSPAKLGDRMLSSDKVRVDGRDIRLLNEDQRKCRVLLYNKPEGEMCTRKDPEGRPTIFEKLPLLRNGRWIGVGRLDFNTSGVLILTNDGELANKLMHPSANLEREYAVRVQGQVSPGMLTTLRKGVELDDGPAHFEQLTDAGGEGSNHWYHVIVKQGRNRLVRRLWESQGVVVSRLIRIRFGSITLPRMLRRGKWHELTLNEIAQLKDDKNLAVSVENTQAKKAKYTFANKNGDETQSSDSTKVLRLKRNSNKDHDEEYVPVRVLPRKERVFKSEEKRTNRPFKKSDGRNTKFKNKKRD